MASPAQPQTLDIGLPSCGKTLCNSHGLCIPSPDGGEVTVCDCLLGYTGEFCEDTMNKSISVPLTIWVIVFIIVTVVLAFVCAFVRQKQNRRRRMAWAAAQEDLKSGVASGETSFPKFEDKFST